MPTGTSLSSTVDGKVVYAGFGQKGSGYGGYGNVVVIMDSNGDYHMFAHLDSVGVKVGTTLTRGSYIGKSGNTGNSTGPHLHYEVRRKGKLGDTINPNNYL